MTVLFSENFEKLAKIIFDFYDFDKDGKISKEDVKVVLSYIPLNIKKFSKNFKFVKEEFKDRVESQDELHELITKCFIFDNQNYLNESQFLKVIENISSDIFLFILIFLFEKKPFSNSSIKEFEGKKLKTSLIKINRTPILTSKYIASPNLKSKFSPSLSIKKSPMMTKRLKLNLEEEENNHKNNISLRKKESKNLLMKFAGFNLKENNSKASKTVLLKNSKITLSSKEKGINAEVQESNENNENLEDEEIPEENISIKNIPVNRKKRNDLKNLGLLKLTEIRNIRKFESISDFNKTFLTYRKEEKR